MGNEEYAKELRSLALEMMAVLDRMSNDGMPDRCARIYVSISDDYDLGDYLSIETSTATVTGDVGSSSIVLSDFVKREEATQ